MDALPPATPPIQPVTVECIIEAARTYQLHPYLLVAVLQVEGGRPGLAVRNPDGTYDHGPMQINSVRIEDINRLVPGANLTPARVRNDGCLNVKLGAWILRYEVNRAGGDVWAGIGNYHYNASGSSPRHHHRYRAKVARALQKVLTLLGVSRLAASAPLTPP